MRGRTSVVAAGCMRGELICRLPDQALATFSLPHCELTSKQARCAAEAPTECLDALA